jgi:pimeloyl-ACP methyl ester carboxylesterase
MSRRRSKRSGRSIGTTSAGDPIRPPRAALPDWMGDSRVFLPQGYEAGYRYPLLVWLPGAEAFDLGRAMARVSLRNFVAVQAATPAPGSDLSEPAWDAIDRACGRLSVHPDRIYLVGQGDGGRDAFRIACRAPRSFAGVASLGGGFPLDEGLFARIADIRRLPMLLCCPRDGDESAAAQTDRTLRLFHAAGAQLAMRMYPAAVGEAVSRAMLADLNRWVMDGVCGAAEPRHAAYAT